jgi:dolichyl-phosphate-mannose--protein O-mannosyl transferase
MTDNDLYAWAGWNYVHGLSPDKLNFEHPPLAKYLIGLSELAFGSQVVIGAALGAATVVLVYLISRKFLPGYYALLPSALLAFDRLFLGFSAASELDIYATFFVSAYVLLFISYPHSKWAWMPLGLTIGAAVASKWPGICAVPALAIYAAIERDSKALRLLIFSLPIAALAYMSAYGVFFLDGHSLEGFVTLQLQMLNFQQHYRFGRGTPPPFWLLFNFLTGVEGPATFTKMFVNWSQKKLETLSVTYGLSFLSAYNPFTWPLSFSASILTFPYSWKSHKPLPMIPALAFFSFIALTAYGQVFIWYILPALPFAFIALSYVLYRICSSIKPRHALPLILGYLAAVIVWSYLFQLPSFVATS